MSLTLTWSVVWSASASPIWPASSWERPTLPGRLEDPCQGRPPEVGVDDDRGLARLAEDPGEGRRDGRLALVRVRARDDDAARRVVDGDEAQVGAHLPEGLRRLAELVEPAAAPLPAQLGRRRDDPDDARPDELLDVGDGAHPGVELAPEDEDEVADEEPDEAADEDVALEVRGDPGSGQRRLDRDDLDEGVGARGCSPRPARCGWPPPRSPR